MLANPARATAISAIVRRVSRCSMNPRVAVQRIGVQRWVRATGARRELQRSCQLARAAPGPCPCGKKSPDGGLRSRRYADLVWFRGLILVLAPPAPTPRDRLDEPSARSFRRLSGRFYTKTHSALLRDRLPAKTPYRCVLDREVRTSFPREPPLHARGILKAMKPIGGRPRRRRRLHLPPVLARRTLPGEGIELVFGCVLYMT